MLRPPRRTTVATDANFVVPREGAPALAPEQEGTEACPQRPGRRRRGVASRSPGASRSISAVDSSSAVGVETPPGVVHGVDHRAIARNSRKPRQRREGAPSGHGPRRWPSPPAGTQHARPRRRSLEDQTSARATGKRGPSRLAAARGSSRSAKRDQMPSSTASATGGDCRSTRPSTGMRSATSSAAAISDG